MTLTTQELQTKLWQAADILRGQIDSADYKNFIFSMLFLKRLSDRVSTRRSKRRWPLVCPGRPPWRTWTSTSLPCPRKPTGTRSAPHL